MIARNSWLGHMFRSHTYLILCKYNNNLLILRLGDKDPKLFIHDLNNLENTIFSLQ